MVERLFLCGLREDQQRAYRQAVQLSIDGQDPGSANVHFRIDEIPRRMAANVPAVVYDLLRLAAYVHAADSLVSRGSDHATDLGARWRRQMRLVVAVQEMTTWKQPEVVSALEEVLAFLTDDVWRFEFVQRASEPEPSYLNFGLPDQDAARSEVILFSGGLDSLAGAVSTLATTTWPVFLVSHQSSGVITNRRNELVAQLANRFPGRVFHVPVTAHLMGGLKAHEYTQRTRSFLFTAIAVAVADLEGLSTIRFFENGVMSVNLPISGQFMGTTASRTTHPRSLTLLQHFLSKVLSKSVSVENSFIWKTKAETLAYLTEFDTTQLIASTVSCSRSMDYATTGMHCGSCIQCIQRRIAILAAGLAEHESSANYKIDLMLDPREEPDARTTAVDLVRSAREFAQLTDEGFLSRYAGQFAQVIGCFDALGEEDTAARLIALLRRYGREVQRVLSQAIELNKDAIAAGAVSPNSLLGITLGTREVSAKDFSQSNRGMAPSDGANRIFSEDLHSFEVRLAVDSNKRRILIDGMSPVTERAFFDVFANLVQQHQQDADERRVPENYRSIRAEVLAEKLGVSESSLRRRILRIRKRIDQQLFQGSRERRHLDAVIENPSKGSGYRLNPYVWVVAPSEITPDA